MPRKASKSVSKKSSASNRKKKGSEKGDKKEDRNALWGYDMGCLLGGLCSLVGGALLVFATTQGKEWWHIKREYTEIWIGLAQTCVNWRGSYNCESNVYQDYESDGCSVTGDSVKSRHNMVTYLSFTAAIFAILLAISCAVVVFKFRRYQSMPVRLLGCFSIVTVGLSGAAAGIFYQTRSTFAFCQDYCTLTDGACVSEHGPTMKIVIAAGVLQFITVLATGSKNFDPRINDVPGDSDDEAGSGDDFDDVMARKKGAKKALPEADEISDTDTVPAARNGGQRGGGRANAVKRNPIRSNREIQRGAAVEQQQYADEGPVAYEEEEAPAAAEEGGEDWESQYVWDEEVGMYWSYEYNMHCDFDSGHYYDSGSGMWYDPENDYWYEV